MITRTHASVHLLTITTQILKSMVGFLSHLCLQIFATET